MKHIFALSTVLGAGCTAGPGGTDGFTADAGGCVSGLQDNDHDGRCTAACTSTTCSSHGACSDTTGTARCTCTGGYTGSDCSACPTGMQDHDSNGVCGAACAPGTCSSHGNCSDATGTARCVCTGGYSGTDCSTCATGTQDGDHDGVCSPACTATTCSGHGACVDTSGTATCTCTGGFTGATCAACPARMQDNDHDGLCALGCTAASCSNHGTCTDTTGAAVCACTGSYTGADCSTCPAGQQDRDGNGTCSPACTAAACGAHATCDDTTGTIACTCTGGYAGEGCAACAAGTQDNDHDGACTAGCAAATCTSHGACVDATGTPVCTCAGGYTGASCNACAPGLQDNDHNGTCTAVCAASTCTGRGACSDATGTATCTCAGGYTGASCSACGTGTQDNDADGICTASCSATSCSSHGACSDQTGTQVCSCSGNYTGATCDVCGSGLQDNDHDGVCTAACGATSCNGHGTCADATGTPVCTCSGGYTGASCSACGSGLQDNDHDGVCTASCSASSCSAHGACSDATGAQVCSCTGNYTGTNCDVCGSGLQDNDHEGTCTATCGATTCSGHGTCSDATGTTACTCATGYLGSNCSNCSAGLQDNDRDGVCTAACASGTCSNHGACSDATGATVCTCSGNYTGASCDACASGLQDNDHDGACTAACGASTCSGHGTCSDATGTPVCACTGNHTGSDCSVCSSGYQDNDHDGVCTAACTALTCSGHGSCTDTTGALACTCTGGHGGTVCDVCTTGLQDNDNDGTCTAACASTTCSGHGTCVDTTGTTACTCSGGYTGASCSACGTGLQDNDGNGTCTASCTTATCGGHGTCVDTTGDTVCTCTGSYTGTVCDVCGTGLQDNDHDGVCTAACGASSCNNGRGTCADTTGTIACTCNGGYTGTSCSACATGTQDNDGNGVCSASCTASTCVHGSCSDTTGTATCTCTGNYSGTTCNSCPTGYQDNDSNGTCTVACTQTECNAHGYCVDSSGTATCSCGAPYGGTTCATACYTQRTWSTCSGTGNFGCSLATESTWHEYSCAGGSTQTYCSGGNVTNVQLTYDFGSSVEISRVRMLSDWWYKRPSSWKVYVGQSATDLPGGTATLVYSDAAQRGTYQCVNGAACTSEVPDGCCPDGRNAVQRLTGTYSPYYSKWDDAAFVAESGRYWYVVFPASQYTPALGMRSIQFYDNACQ